MNPEFVWAIIVIFLALALAAAAIGLYFFWKDDNDYDENKKIVVWGLAIGSIVTIICGILLLVWGIQKKRHIDVTKKTAKQNDKLAAAAAKRSKYLTALPRTVPGKVTMAAQKPGTLPPPVAYAGKGETSLGLARQRTPVQFANKGETS